MTEFEKWFKNIEKEYPKYQDKDGYNIGNTRALKVGWKAALEWVLSLKEGMSGSEIISPEDIEEEVEE